MKKYANKTIKQERFEDIKQEALVDLMVAAAYANNVFTKVCSVHGITLPQYNVLRILFGVYPDMYPPSEIGKRMIDNAHLKYSLEKLEAMALIKKVPSENSRRLLLTITTKGIDALRALAPLFVKAQDEITRNLSEPELKQLSVLIKKIKE